MPVTEAQARANKKWRNKQYFEGKKLVQSFVEPEVKAAWNSRKQELGLTNEQFTEYLLLKDKGE